MLIVSIRDGICGIVGTPGAWKVSTTCVISIAGTITNATSARGIPASIYSVTRAISYWKRITIRTSIGSIARVFPAICNQVATASIRANAGVF